MIIIIISCYKYFNIESNIHCFILYNVHILSLPPPPPVPGLGRGRGRGTGKGKNPPPLPPPPVPPPLPAVAAPMSMYPKNRSPVALVSVR